MAEAVGASAQSTSQQSITTRYAYHPFCNKPTTIVDPRGTDLAFAPSNGGLRSEARYTTTIAYNAACQPIRILQPRANPSGVPSQAFTSGYANQLAQDTFTYDPAGQLLTHKDAGGVITSFAYYGAPSSPGKPAKYLASVTVDPGAAPHLNLVTSFEYTAFGVMNKTTDPNGNVHSYDVDLRGRVTQETGPAVAAAEGSAALRTRWTYDANDNVVRVEREKAPGSGTYTRVDATYDALGRVTSTTSHPTPTHEITTTYAYDSNGNLIRSAGGEGEIRTWAYDERDLALTQSGPDGGTYAYDANGNLASFTDPLGRQTTFEYDGYDRLAVATDAMQTRYVTSYDPAGNVVNQKGLAASSGRVLFERTYARDELGRPYQHREWMQAAATMPAGSAANPAGRWVTTLQEYDARGLVTRVVDDNGRLMTVTYDAAGRALRSTDALGNAQSRAYDRNGNTVNLTRTTAGATGACPRVCTTLYAYDALDRQVMATNPDGTTSHFAYDGRDNLVRTIDEAGHVVWHDHDDADRPIATRRVLDAPSGAVVTTTTEWDDEGRVIQACDDAGDCTVTTYVPATGLPATQTRPMGPSVANAYDAGGNLVGASYSSGKSVELAYDALDRLTSVSLSGAPASAGTTRQQFQYDELGRLTLATDNGVGSLGTGVVTSLGQITVTQQFDTLDRVIGESQLGLPVSHTFDGVGNRLSTTYPSLDGRIVSRSYDAAERLLRVWDTKDQNGLIASYTYNGTRIASKAFGGPPSAAAPVARTAITYDSMERPAAIQHLRGSTSLATLTTGYDAAGNRAAQELRADATDAFSQIYKHDALDRTERWERGSLDANAAPTTVATWEVDGQNDWVTYDPGTGPCTRTTGVSGSPPIRDVSDVCPNDPARTRVYTYDADGNLAWDGTHAYHWDFLNRLIRVDDAQGQLIVGYGYDALGRRVVKIFPENLAGAPGVQATDESWFTFSGAHVVQESQPLGSVLPQGVAPTAPNVHVIRQWVYGPNIDEALAMDVDAGQDGRGAIGAGDKRYYYAYDSGANVLGLISETGRMVEGYAYDAYGAVTILIPASGRQDVLWDGLDAPSEGLYGNDPTPHPYSPAGNLWYFTGRQYDPEIGSYNYRARQYHPTLGQFMSIDPIGAWGDAANLGNPYTYVGNNPGTWSDPSGLFLETLWDVANVGLDVYSLQDNVRHGRWGWAAVDVGALALDVGATALPFIPGGAGMAVKGARAVETTIDTTTTVDRSLNAVNALDETVDITRVADSVQDGAKAGDGLRRTPQTVSDAPVPREVDFLVGPKGDVIPVPKGASGPLPTLNRNDKVKGFHFQGGSGGQGLSPRVDTVRVMDPKPGAPDGYVVYMNRAGQGVHPYTGQTLADKDPWRHLLLGGGR